MYNLQYAKRNKNMQKSSLRNSHKDAFNIKDCKHVWHPVCYIHIFTNKYVIISAPLYAVYKLFAKKLNFLLFFFVAYEMLRLFQSSLNSVEWWLHVYC